MLSYVVERLRRVKNADSIILATTDKPLDDPLIDFCRKENLAYFRGSEEDVLDRFLRAGRECKADVIVRITADCPLNDPAIIDQVIAYFLKESPKYDYVSNTAVRTYPRGMDVEVFSMHSFEKIAKLAQLPEEREHVTPYYYRHPELFNLGSLLQSKNESDYRLTVDTQEDFRLISAIIQEIYPRKPDFNLEDIIAVLQKHPDWLKINAHIQQKAL